jgi:hypothetical protein
MWRAQNDDAIKQLDEQQQAMFEQMHAGGGPPDQDQMMQLFEQRRQLMETAPTGEDQATQVKALLTPEQLKQFETRHAEMEEQQQAGMQRFPIRALQRAKDKDAKGR